MLFCPILMINIWVFLTKQDEEAVRWDALQTQTVLIKLVESAALWLAGCRVTVCDLWPLGLGWTPAARRGQQEAPPAGRHEEETPTSRGQLPSTDLRTEKTLFKTEWCTQNYKGLLNTDVRKFYLKQSVIQNNMKSFIKCRQ